MLAHLRVSAAGLTIAGALLLPVQASASRTDPSFARVGAYQITPNPIAATGSLPPGQKVNLTLTALDTIGRPDPFAYVWIALVGQWPDGHNNPTPFGTLTVNATRVGTNGNRDKYQVDRHGQLTMTFAAGSPYKPGFQDGVLATRLGGGGQPCACAVDWYTY